MNDIQRYSQLVEPPHNLMRSSKGYWCKYSDHETEHKADKERIAKLHEMIQDLIQRCEAKDLSVTLFKQLG